MGVQKASPCVAPPARAWSFHSFCVSRVSVAEQIPLQRGKWFALCIGMTRLYREGGPTTRAPTMNINAAGSTPMCALEEVTVTCAKSSTCRAGRCVIILVSTLALACTPAANS